MSGEHIDTTYNTKDGKSETVCNLDPTTTVKEDDHKVVIRHYETSGKSLLGDPVRDDSRYTETVIPKSQITSTTRTRRESSGCFISTACVEAQGLPDDCQELTILRRWRDSYVAKRSGGADLLEEYYASAPDLVEQISKRSDAAEIWREVYRRLTDAVQLIRDGKDAEALDLYTTVTQDLKRRVTLTT